MYDDNDDILLNKKVKSKKLILVIIPLRLYIKSRNVFFNKIK